MRVHEPMCLPGESLGSGWWQIRCRGRFDECRVLPLLVGCGAFVCAAVVGIEDGGFGGSKCGEVVAAENSWCVATGCEEVEHSFQMIEEHFLIAGLDGVVEHVLAFGVAEADELFVPFYALRVDGSDVVVAEAFADGPC